MLIEHSSCKGSRTRARYAGIEQYPAGGNENVAELHPLDEEGVFLDEEAPVVAIGGLKTVKRLALYYTALTGSRDRFIAPPFGGVAKPEDIRAKFQEDLHEMYEKLGRMPMRLVGHSFGGFLAFRAGLEMPHMVSEVYSLGGVHLGYSKETLATRGLRHAVGNPPEAELLKAESTYMQEHKEEVESDWPADIPIHVISTAMDVLVVPPQGYEMDLKSGAPVEKRVIINPPLPGVESAVRKFWNIPKDVKALPSWFFTEHLNLPLNPDVIRYIHQDRTPLQNLGGNVISMIFKPRPSRPEAAAA